VRRRAKTDDIFPGAANKTAPQAAAESAGRESIFSSAGIAPQMPRGKGLKVKKAD